MRESEPDARAKLNLLLKFSKRESMYLPGMPCDDPDILCNAIQFDGICQIRSDDLLLANASHHFPSLVGVSLPLSREQ
jgi:hypothetical protein